MSNANGILATYNRPILLWIAIIEYCARRGYFQSIEDLEKVPIDPEKIEAKKDISNSSGQPVPQMPAVGRVL